MDRRWIVACVSGLLPFAAAPWITRSLSDLAARWIVDRMELVAPALLVDNAPAPELAPLHPSDLTQELKLSNHVARARKDARSAEDRKQPPKKGVLIRREVVRAAVRAGVRPSGTPEAATDDHPAGLRVFGVGGTGALRDGDIITRVGGIAPRSTEDVIGVVAGAYRNKAYVLSGEFWRDGERWNAVVELPEPRSNHDRRREPDP